MTVIQIGNPLPRFKRMLNIAGTDENLHKHLPFG
jgi:hypothetical protein